MTDLVKFKISADFIIGNAQLTSSEIVFGYQDSWIDESGVIALFLNLYNCGARLSAPEEDLALLLSDDASQVADLVERVNEEGKEKRDSSELWLYLALAWLHEHRADFDDPFEVIEMLFANFGHPAEINGLVRFMPPASGQEAGLPVIERKWQQYLAAKREKYLDQRPSMH